MNDEIKLLKNKLQEAERQRDEAKRHEREANKGAEINAHINTELIRKRLVVEAERDQLIKVVDELADAIRWNKKSGVGFYGDEAMKAYSLLPHVQAKKGNKR